jgi:hypothetical protein
MALTTAYRQQMLLSNPHLTSHVYRIALLAHLGATPVRLTRLESLAARSPAGTDVYGQAVSAAAQFTGLGYTAGGELVTLTTDIVGEVARLLIQSGPAWGTLTGDVRGAVLYNTNLELGSPSSILAVWTAAEALTRSAEPLRLTFTTGEIALLPAEA